MVIEIKASIRETLRDDVRDAPNELEVVTDIAVVTRRTYDHAVRNVGFKQIEKTELEADNSE